MAVTSFETDWACLPALTDVALPPRNVMTQRMRSSLCASGSDFRSHRKLPYKKMLVLTGIMLGSVLLVMVGEQAQEMQLATQIPWLANVTPAWMGLWFSVFPTIQTLTAQANAGALVIGSYFVAWS